MITRNLSRRFLLLAVSMVVPLAMLFAASESYVQTLTGHLKKGDSVTVIDDKFLNLPLDQWNQLKHLSIDDIITFELRHDTTVKYYTQPFSCTLNVTIRYYTSRDQQTPQEIDSVNLVVKFDTARGKAYADFARYQFKNAFKVTVVINSISSPEWKDKIPDCFRIKNEILVERKYPFDPNHNGKLHLGAFQLIGPGENLVAANGPDVDEPGGPTIGTQAVNGQLAISWSAADFTGAEEYDLEWCFIDGLSGRAAALLSYGTPGQSIIPINIEDQWMLHDATRVTVTSSPYTINLPYFDGYLLVRIRQASYEGNLRITGSWVYSSDDNDYTAVVVVPAHAPGLNWQYTGSFAEEGKRKEVITYFDASQRGRQSVTINNSDLTTKNDGSVSPTAVVQETIYDIMGRAAVNVLPAPTKSSLLDYVPSFNLYNSTTPYSYSNIHLDQAVGANACAIAADPMSTLNGASQYYSPSNSFLDAANLQNYYFNPYIPDAQGYPYSLTQYLPDNTGRVRRQGGVGPTLQAGLGKETNFFYGKPTPTELQRLFGSEVGDPSHYLKNVIIDPNGQASISFVDANGKTIATCLAGSPPGTMDGITGSTQAVAHNHFNDVLIEPNDLSVDAGQLSMTATATFTADMQSQDTVVYSVDPLALVTPYAGGASTLCNDCYYTVSVTVKDECGNTITSAQSTPFQVDDYTCYVNPAPVTGIVPFGVPNAGQYTVNYSLQLSNNVINSEVNDYISTNTDLKTLQTFFVQQLNSLNLSGCYSTCDACKMLGTLQTFQSEVATLLAGPGYVGINVNDPNVQSWISTTYQTLSAQCSQLSCSATSPCDQKLTQMEQDCIPGGQYALYDVTAITNGATNVFLEPATNVMEYYTTDATISALSFTADDGKTKTVGSLSQADFVRAYLEHPEWVSYFVVHHIEYCSYLWCKDASNPTPADNNEVSYTFDANLQSEYANGSDAVAGGFYSHADPLNLLEKDPFFNNGGRGVPYYSQMQSDLQNISTVLGGAPADPSTGVALPVKNILQYVDWTLYCKPTDPSATGAQMVSSWNNCAPNDACRSVTMEWTMYLNYYLQLKSKYYRIAKLAYYAATAYTEPSTGNTANSGCLDCIIGTDPLATSGCVPPNQLTQYYVELVSENGNCNSYIRYNNGSNPQSPIPGNYTFTYQLMQNSPTLGPVVIGGPYTITANEGDPGELISSTPLAFGAQCGSDTYYSVIGITCTPSALASCAASQSTSQACPSSSNFSIQYGTLNIIRPGAQYGHTQDVYYVSNSGPVSIPVTVYVQLSYQNLYTPISAGLNTSGTRALTVTMQPGQSSVLIGTNTDISDNESSNGVDYIIEEIDNYSVVSPYVSCPPENPTSTCTSNPLYALYADKNRVFNDYTDVQDYASCIASEASSGTISGSVAATNALAQAEANLTATSGDWLNELENVVSQSQDPQIAAITTTTLQNLVNNMYQVSDAYFQYALAKSLPLNIVNSLPGDFSSVVSSSPTYSSFLNAFNAIVGSALVQKGFGPDLIGNAYPYGASPYPADPNVVQLTSDIWTNVQTNLTAFENAYAAAGSPGGSFPAYLQQQLGDDDIMTAGQVTDLQNKVSGGCTFPYLSAPTILPVALVASKPSIGCNDMSALMSNFQLAYPNVVNDGSLFYQTVFTNFMNHSLGYPLSYADYSGFLTTCTTQSTAILYDKPETPSVYVDPFACPTEVLHNAYNEAGQAYSLYIAQVRIQIRNAYISKCLDNQASANLRGDDYQYHFTLYYYDQSGNLVKTIPPEGVHLLSDQDLSTLQNLPAQTPASCPAPSIPTLNSQQGVLTGLSGDLQTGSADGMEMWLYSTSGTSTRQVRMVTADNNYMVQAAIANGYLWFEIYSMQPQTGGTGIALSLTNEVVAALPPQLTLQSWTYLLVQSPGGLLGGNLTLYIDGNKLTNVPLGTAPSYPYAWEIDGVTSGGYIVPATDMSLVQHIRLYNSLLPDPQVAADFNNSCLGVGSTAPVLWGILNQPSPCDNPGTATAVSIPDQGALAIASNPNPNSSNNYAFTNVVNNFTIEFWVKPNQGVTDDIGNLSDIFAGIDYTPPYVIHPTYGGPAANGTADVGVAVGTDGITVFERAENYVPAVLDWRGNVGKWTHVAVVYNNLIPSLYVNGILVATGTIPPRKTAISPSYDIGGGGYGYMAGGIDEVRIWGVARTQQQILAAYTQGLASSDRQGLVGYWTMDGNSGSIMHDASCNGNDIPLVAPAMSWSTTSTAGISDINYVPFVNRLIVPNHGLPTYYANNSLNQVVQQTSPDAGVSNFYYDRLGRLSVSQNAEQLQPAVSDSYNQSNRFSYTRYDGLGRIIEVGEKLSAGAISETIARDNGLLGGWYTSGANRQVTVTAYDAYPSWAPSEVPKTTLNLRKRVAATALLSSGSDGSQNRLSGSYYMYDYDGNVSELMQENTALINNEKQLVTGSTGIKDIQYQYDLISGKVNKVLYQDGKWDQFYYQYIYDADNRLIKAYSSRQNYPALSYWNLEALYRYYLHGPLARMELGVKGYKQGVQGMDYAYTLQGWLKGVNGEQVPIDGTTTFGMTANGIPGTPFEGTAMDVLGYSLGYFQGDYTPIQPSYAFRISFTPNVDNSGSGTNLYNGNIRYATYAMTPFTLGAQLTGLTGYTYRYDQLNRLTAMDHYNIGQTDGSIGWSSAGYYINTYGEKISYDGNGNILTDNKLGWGRGQVMDDLTYNYNRDVSGNLLGNRLGYINDKEGVVYGTDLGNQVAGNYTYDNNGNLIADVSQKLGMIYWNVYGKMAQIYQGTVQAQGGVYGSGPGLQYGYDPGGNRITKTATAANGTSTTTHYVRDAQGNVLAVYQYKANGSGALTEGDWLEQDLYGSSRLGMLQPNVAILAGQALANDSYQGGMDASINSAGHRLYELTNHLGNVMTTVSDLPINPGQSGNTGVGLMTSIVSATDYYPFGMEMPGRTYIVGGPGIATPSSLNYRYGFNGKENDNEVEGVGNSIDYGMRVYDPRVGRFMSTDPLTREYPNLTPYQYASNSPIRFIDADGLEHANPSIFTTAINTISGNFHLNRLNAYLTENKIPDENVISLPNETYVVLNMTKNKETGMSTTSYSIFRQSKANNYYVGWSSKNDDINLTESQFINTQVLGDDVIPADLPIGEGASAAGVILQGGKNAYYSWRGVVATVQTGVKELKYWKSAIRFGKLDAMGISKDLIKKGFHMHFSELGGLELGLKPMQNSKIGLAFLAGNSENLNEAIKLFNGAMANKGFRSALLAQLKAAQETLNQASKVLHNTREAEMAGDKAHEINYLIKAVENF